MKKTAILTLLTLLAVISVRADLIWYEGFNYPNGNLTNVSSGLWIWASGSGQDLLVNNHKLEIAATGGIPVSRTDDEFRSLAIAAGSTYTNSSQVLYASFTVNCTNLPNAAGTYFATFYNPVAGTSGGFWGRAYAVTSGTALPNTWRLAVAGRSTAFSKVYPVDLALNTDYQVVIRWDPVTLFAATIWVNPINSSDPSVTSNDGLTPPAIPVNSFAFRQAGSFGNFFATVSNLAVATTFDEAATNVWSTNAVSPVVLRSPAARTNFIGDVVNLTALATGQGLGSLTYQWQQNGTDISNPNGNTNVFTIASAAVSDTGNYQMIVTTPYGLSATSTPALLWVTNSTLPPTITVQPATNTSVYPHQTATLKVTAIGPPTITYQWYYNDGALGPNATGDGTDTLTITDVQTNNGTAGTYRCAVSNDFGGLLSTNAVVRVVNPPAVSITYLRTLVDITTYLPTNSTLLYEVTGTVTTFTNLTTANTSSYYLQDATAGINIFATFGASFRPMQGDVVTFVGFLSTFNSVLELEADTVNNLATSYTVLSNNIASLPAPKVIPFSITNNLAFCETNLEGSIVMLTNVYFGTNAGTIINTNVGANATFIVVSNANGETFNIGTAATNANTAGQIWPSFAHTVVGVFSQNLGSTVTPRNQGYQLTLTRFSDIVTNPLTVSVSYSNSTATLSWDAAPYSYSYKVLASTNVAGPYLPLISNQHFIDTTGTYDDTSAASLKFYRLSTP